LQQQFFPLLIIVCIIGKPKYHGPNPMGRRKMAKRRILLTSLSTLALTGVLALGGCAGEGEGEAEGEDRNAGPASMAPAGGGEGEGEGEGASASSDPATNDVEYLRRLGLVRGHLAAFIELYRAGEYDAAITHAKHPESELYAGLRPAFAAREKPGFAQELEAVVSAAQARGDVEAAYEALSAAISANVPDTDLSTLLLAVAEIVTTAGNEFDIGVEDDGAISNAHEYQDAYGFLTAAQMMLAGRETADASESEAIAQVREQLDQALTIFIGDLMATRADGAPSTFYGAAARIEIAALGLQ
jgi:hypothetical protein